MNKDSSAAKAVILSSLKIAMTSNEYISITRQWVDEMVIGLNLCPFARKVADAGLIRYSVSPSSSTMVMLASLETELYKLLETPRTAIETSFLIFPNASPDFLDFNDFVGMSEELVRDLRQEGEVQIVGFHPEFRFAITDPEGVENYTNRSPFPMLHLLREVSVSEVSVDEKRIQEIPQRNTETLRQLGLKNIQDRLKAILKR